MILEIHEIEGKIYKTAIAANALRVKCWAIEKEHSQN